MKKIMCFVLAMLMLMSLFSFSAFAQENTELADLFYDYCVEKLPEDMQPEEGDEVAIYSTVEIDGVTFFRANSWVFTGYEGVYAKFGDVNIYCNKPYYPYELGLYALSGDEIYTLEEAYNNGLIEDVSLLKDRYDGGFYTFYEDYVPNPENKYESYVIQKVFTPDEWTQEDHIAYYTEVYEYYPDGVVSTDEAVPDYVLIYLNTTRVLHAPTGCVLGDYAFYSMSCGYPFAFGDCIYVPKTGEVYDLIRAYELGIEGIDKVFTETKIGRLMGDMDKDRRLSIKDATYIQKTIAGFEGYSFEGIFASRYDESLPSSIADYNRDREANIKDATAIQKHLAGIVE